MQQILRLIFVVSNFLYFTSASDQRVVVKGLLLCGEKPYEGATVKLIEKDVIKDDLMGEMKTKKDGTFYLDGHDNEIGTIEPVLKIYHDCDDTKLGVEVPCQRRWAFPLPKMAIQPPGSKNPKVFDFGTYNLELRMKDEGHDCIH